MKNIIERIYFGSPALIQNIAISMASYKQKRERFNRHGIEMLNVLEKNMTLTRDEIQKYQSHAFVSLARHAITTTPFYKQWARDNAINPLDINTIEDINLFPVIKKDLLKENATLFISNDQKLQSSQFALYTSGTTGTPLKVITDNISRSRHYAFFSRLRRQFYIGNRERRATLFGRTVISANQSSPPFWRMDYTQNNLLMSSYHLQENNLFDYYTKLLTFNPSEIFSYPSSIFFIADFIVKNSLPSPNVKLIMITAENLLPAQKIIIETAFNCVVINQYGCTEMAFFAADNRAGEMELHPEHGISEVILNDDEIDFSGTGNHLATGFINYSMPIIRYDIGDVITLNTRNEAGRQIISDVDGRSDDVIYRKDGSPVGRVGSIFKSIDSIKYGQLVQNQDGSINIFLVPAESYTDTDGSIIAHQLRLRIGDELPIRVSTVENISKSGSKKFKMIISNYEC